MAKCLFVFWLFGFCAAQHIGFFQLGEELAVDWFITQLAVQAFAVAILPRLPGSMQNI